MYSEPVIFWELHHILYVSVISCKLLATHCNYSTIIFKLEGFWGLMYTTYIMTLKNSEGGNLMSHKHHHSHSHHHHDHHRTHNRTHRESIIERVDEEIYTENVSTEDNTLDLVATTTPIQINNDRIIEKQIENISKQNGDIETGPENEVDNANITYGNTPGNIINKGIAAKYKDYIFYQNQNDNYSLYRMKSDGIEKQKICDDNPFYLNVLPNKIYYIHENNIYSINFDGTNRVKLYDSYCKNLIIYNGFIYYIDSVDSSKIYRMNLDGTYRTKICDDYCSAMNIFEECIYYQNQSDGGKIYKFNLKDSLKQPICNDRTWYTVLCDKNIYYQNQSDGFTLYSIEINGSNRKKLTTTPVSYINVNSDFIFYHSQENHHTLNKMCLDGTGIVRVSNDFDPALINLIDNKIFYYENYTYYHNRSESPKIISINSDGSSRHYL